MGFVLDFLGEMDKIYKSVLDFSNELGFKNEINFIKWTRFLKKSKDLLSM